MHHDRFRTESELSGSDTRTANETSAENFYSALNLAGESGSDLNLDLRQAQAQGQVQTAPRVRKAKRASTIGGPGDASFSLTGEGEAGVHLNVKKPILQTRATEAFAVPKEERTKRKRLHADSLRISRAASGLLTLNRNRAEVRCIIENRGEDFKRIYK